MIVFGDIVYRLFFAKWHLSSIRSFHSVVRQSLPQTDPDLPTDKYEK